MPLLYLMISAGETNCRTSSSFIFKKNMRFRFFILFSSAFGMYTRDQKTCDKLLNEIHLDKMEYEDPSDAMIFCELMRVVLRPSPPQNNLQVFWVNKSFKLKLYFLIKVIVGEIILDSTEIDFAGFSNLHIIDDKIVVWFPVFCDFSCPRSTSLAASCRTGAPLRPGSNSTFWNLVENEPSCPVTLFY